MLTMPRPRSKDESLRDLIVKFFNFSKSLRLCKKDLKHCKDISLRKSFEELEDHYGNQAQINLFKIEIEWEEIKHLIKEAL